MPTKTLENLALVCSGKVHGNSGVEVYDALPLQDACHGHLTLVDSLKQLDRWISSEAKAAIAPHEFAAQLHSESGKSIIGVDKIHESFIAAIHALRIQRQIPTNLKHPTAAVDLTSSTGSDCYIGPHASIAEGCTIGDGCRIHANVHIMAGCIVGSNCELFPGVVLYPGTVLEDNVLLHANAVIGAYGFGYRQVQGRHERTAQLGWVHIERDVEVGAGTTIDRGTYGPTRIGQGTKLDNLIQIGHNVHVGKHNLVCAQAGIAGSSSTGDYVVLGGQVGMRDHIHIGNRVMAAAQSGLANDVPDGVVVMGTPALPQKESAQIMMASTRLPEMRKQLRQLEKTVASIENQLANDAQSQQTQRAKAA